MTDKNKEMNLLESQLDLYAREADKALYVREADDVVVCRACAHQCRMQPGKRGICRMRFNREGCLYAPAGYVAGVQVDPIEKKPLYHVLPGSNTLSFGMLGCNFRCDFCQNWVSSQTLRDAAALAGVRPCSAKTLVDTALQEQAQTVVSTYNEPLITADWAAEVFREAKEHGLLCGFVSNGYATREVLEYLRPVMDIFKVDLKCFSEEGYRQLGGRLKPVQETIAWLLELGFWTEVVTLVVPDFNDSQDELEQMAAFLVSLSPNIPWHVTAFYPTYKHTHVGPTSGDHLIRAWEAGKAAGLRHLYVGNMGGLGERENTCCPSCEAVLIKRRGFHVLQNNLDKGQCPHCGTAIAGRWG